MDLNRKAKIKPAVIVYSYLVIFPILLLFIGDKFILDGYFRKNLPISLDFLIWFNILFNFPHIICSSLLFFDKKYLAAFKIQFLKLVGLALAFVAIGATFWSSSLREATTLFALIWTIKHVVGQQFSMTRIFLRAKEDWLFILWKNYGIFVAVLIFLGIYSRVYTRYFSFIRPTLKLFEQHPWWFILPFLIVTSLLLKRAHDAKNKMGSYMLIANSFMMLSSVLLFSEQYFCLASLGPRIIHDLSAFYFYGVHSFNKKATFKGTSFLAFINRYQPVPLFLLSSVISVSLMYFCLNIHDLTIYHALSAIHFYTESFFWKAGSPSRQFLHF